MTPKFDTALDKTPISWKKLMALRETGKDTFESLTPAWPPAPFKRTFGGHVYAQAVYAASKTISPGFFVHQVTGYFILPGEVDTPFIYRIRRVRDGGVYSLRTVDVYQETEVGGWGKSPCFIATVSFKRPENNSRKFIEFSHQHVPRDHIPTTYHSVLDGKKPEDHPLAPGADALWWEIEEREAWEKVASAFPGVETRKVNMRAYNPVVPVGGGPDGEGTSRWRQLIMYRIILDKPNPPSDPSSPPQPVDLNLHAAAHLYASDRNSLFMIQHAAGYQNVRTSMASLSHTVVFHGVADTMRMTDDQGNPKWFVQEAWTTHNGDKRGCHNSYLWDYYAGRVVATTIQDGMVRFPITPPKHSLNIRPKTAVVQPSITMTTTKNANDDADGDGKSDAVKSRL
ncbi:acyl-CoA thioesterase II [Exophiala mesophila]|uniref:Acyl-CoA thioesterase II n=1 Tax=Exophiala mesophila TaxID=212818 RepID=A0A0D2A3N4_EXOME|nr:acyl-CoA thioesterase II [Exophiala mesophila]KIV93603.1 acyl-CoA thioesterase II [Exophiala mesophila]